LSGTRVISFAWAEKGEEKDFVYELVEGGGFLREKEQLFTLGKEKKSSATGTKGGITRSSSNTRGGKGGRGGEDPSE